MSTLFHEQHRYPHLSQKKDRLLVEFFYLELCCGRFTSNHFDINCYESHTTREDAEIARQRKHESELSLESNKTNHHKYKNTKFNVVRRECLRLEYREEITRVTRILSLTTLNDGNKICT